jgi:predicted nucleic acid-binding protein
VGRQFIQDAVGERYLVILVDTSVFIDFFNGKHSKLSEILIETIENSEDICTCGLIITEILQGIRSDREYDRIKDILSGLVYLPITKNMFIHAASMYRTIRRNGKTIRSPIDCIIASLCLEHDVDLLHNDKDFYIIARYTSLRIVN